MFACARKCSKVLPSRSVGGTHFFIMHENKIHIGWNGISPTTIQDRQLKTRTGITVFVHLCFFFQRKQGILFKCCGCPSPISCLYYLIIRSFYDELNIEMNFTISLWWGDDSPVYLAIQFVVMQLFCYFYVSTWIKKNITSPPCFFRWLRHAFAHALFHLGVTLSLVAYLIKHICIYTFIFLHNIIIKH